MRISNTEIAEMVAKRGYDYSEALDSIDAGKHQKRKNRRSQKQKLITWLTPFVLALIARMNKIITM